MMSFLFIAEEFVKCVFLIKKVVNLFVAFVRA